MITVNSTPAAGTTPKRLDPMRVAAEQVETQFLSQMLKLAGVGKPPAGFGGGHGEDQFYSLLCDAQAKSMVTAGGIGLAEVVFQSLARGADE